MVGLVGMLIIAMAYIFVQMNRVSTPDVTATQAGWAREEGREDDVFIFTLDVTREDPSLDAYCVIYALNYDVAEVGRRDAYPGRRPVDGAWTFHQTREQAVAGEVYGCSTETPKFWARFPAAGRLTRCDPPVVSTTAPVGAGFRIGLERPAFPPIDGLSTALTTQGTPTPTTRGSRRSPTTSSSPSSTPCTRTARSSPPRSTSDAKRAT